MSTALEIHQNFKKSLDTLSFNTDFLKTVSHNQNITRLKDLGLDKTQTYNNLTSIQTQINTVVDFERDVLNIITQSPKYKLIELSQSIELCKKYDLFIGDLSNFSGTIPEKNLRDIEMHKIEIQKTNICLRVTKIINVFDAKDRTNTPCYFIAAPKKDFVENLTEVDRFLCNIDKPKFELNFSMPTLVIDPIVLCPVYVKDSIIFQIVTAWGDEADDDYVKTKTSTRYNKN